jgi:hypothetical protein
MQTDFHVIDTDTMRTAQLLTKQNGVRIITFVDQRTREVLMLRLEPTAIASRDPEREGTWELL